MNVIMVMNKLRILYITLLLMAVSGCKDFLEEKAFSVLRPDTIEDNESSAKMLVNGALSTIGGDLYFQWGIWHRVWNFDGDYETGPDWGMQQLGAGNWQSYGDMYRIWQGPYLLAERSTSAITTISAMTFDEEIRNHYIGQAYFLRAWAYFQLVRGYGGVPIFRSTVVQGAEPQQPRASVQEVYDFIVSDLKNAETLMYSNKHTHYEVGTIARGAAKALLSKVYLTMASGALANAKVTVKGGRATEANDPSKLVDEPQSLTFTKNIVAGHESMDAARYFDSARVKALELIQSNEYDLFPRYADVWTVENRFKTEHIWALQSITNDAVFRNVVSHEFSGSFIEGNLELQGAWYGMRNHWYELFEDDDQRITEGVNHRFYQWGAYRYYPLKDSTKIDEPNDYGWTANDLPMESVGSYRAILRKFEGVAAADRFTQNADFAYPFLRFAEVLLIYAEAENEVNGPTADAYDALRRVRSRSSATEAPAMGKEAFRSFVLEERARELALEGGRRWDLLRWGIYLDVMNAIDIDENNVTKRREARHLLFPLPLGELNSNKNLGGENGGQNPGW